ncbi:MAG: hypothetical protein SPJ97_04170 [Bacteroides sp.]|nr:hypothetical protein [Bacteroides sp.]
MEQKMNLQTAYKECRYSSLSDFRALASWLGYKEEYNDKVFLFGRSDGDCRFSEKQLRDRWSRVTPAEKEHYDSFLRSICSAMNYTNVGSSIDLHGFRLIERDNGDRFIFSPKDKCVCSLGRVLYFALEEGYALDGSGRLLSEEEFTPLREIDGRFMKATRQEDKTVIYYKHEGDPFESSFFQSLSPDEQSVIKGDGTVDVNYEGRLSRVYLDKELNRILVIPYSSERLFTKSLADDDWGQIQRLKESGYVPSAELLERLRTDSPQKAEAVASVFSLSKTEIEKKDALQKQPSTPQQRKEQTRNSCDLVRSMFTDL